MASTLVVSAAIAAFLGVSDATVGAGANGPRVQHIQIIGADRANLTKLQTVADPFLDRPLARSDLVELADEISTACQDEGLFLCRADIHEQDLTDGVLNVFLSEGYFGRIDADPSLLPVLRRVFHRVLKERPAREQTFREAVALLDDIPGLKVTGIRPSRVSGEMYTLEIDGTYDRVGLRGLATNRGSRRDNPWKAYAGLKWGSVMVPGDRMTFGVLTRPEAPEELVFVRTRYDTAPTSRGLRLYTEIAVSNTSPRSELDGRDVDGQLLRGEIGAVYPLVRRDGLRIDARLSADTAYSEENEDGLSLYEDRLHVLRLGISGRKRLGRVAQLSGRFRVSHGLDVLNAGGMSRPDGEAEFTKLELDALLATPIMFGIVGRLGTEAQWSDSPLLFSEEFGVGGGKFGRGYDFGEVLGDHGASAYAEVARPIGIGGLITKAEPYLYADTGSTWNAGDGLSADGTVLWSAGAGLRLTGRHGWTLSYEAAAPLSDAPYTVDDRKVRHRIDIGFKH